MLRGLTVSPFDGPPLVPGRGAGSALACDQRRGGVQRVSSHRSAAQGKTDLFQEAIERIRGVISSRVILDDLGDISEVHIVATVARQPKHIVRDIESLLCARHGIRVDYRRISLVQLDADDIDDGDHRLRFLAASQSPGPIDTVEVSLQASNRRYVGLAPVETHLSHQPTVHAAASATLSAVQEAIGQRIALVVRGMEVVSSDRQQVCLALVEASTAQGEECLAGTCLVVGDLLEAASKATLDAINRRIPVWITAEKRQASDQRSPVRAHAGTLMKGVSPTVA